LFLEGKFPEIKSITQQEQ